MFLTLSGCILSLLAMCYVGKPHVQYAGSHAARIVHEGRNSILRSFSLLLSSSETVISKPSITASLGSQLKGCSLRGRLSTCCQLTLAGFGPVISHAAGTFFAPETSGREKFHYYPQSWDFLMYSLYWIS